MDLDILHLKGVSTSEIFIIQGPVSWVVSCMMDRDMDLEKTPSQAKLMKSGCLPTLALGLC